MIVKRLWVVLALAAVLAGCGGGDNAATPQAVETSLRAQANALAAPTLSDAANQLMDFGERSFPALFAHGPSTIAAGPFLFRFYPSSNVFLGVVVANGSSFLLNHVYVVGPGFGTLSAPRDFGVLTNFITPVDPAPVVVQPPVQVPVNKNLSLTVNVPSIGSAFGPFAVGVAPLPTSQAVFCSQTPSSSAFTQAFAQAGLSGTAKITSCSFSGSTGNIGADVAVDGAGTFAMTITFSYQ